jgi:ribosomal protein S18 acetylase RimI-like enzyme
MTAASDQSGAEALRGGPIRRLADHEIPAALDLLQMGGGASREARGDRFRRFAERYDLPPAQFWAWTQEDGSLRHVAMVMPRPGRTGLCFVSRPARRGLVDELARVVEAAAADAAHTDMTMLQALLEGADDLQHEALRRGGFVDLATLDYLQRSIGRSEPKAACPHGVELIGWAADRHDLFTAALDASYEQTLDCPALRGVRQASDVLQGHMAGGHFDEQLWVVAQVDGEPAAVCLLAELGEQDSVELVYLGVSAAHRHKGLAHYLLQRGIALASQRECRLMTLAVDRRNTPARGLYGSLGFRRFAQRQAMVHILQLAASV